MFELIVGLAIFLGVHSIAIVAPAWRNAMVRRLGAGPWKIAYSFVALIGLVLIVQGYGTARADAAWLYAPPAWTRHLGMLLLLPVFVLLLAAYLPGRIQGRLRHPMLVAVKLWALAHLLMNGSAADVVLFGGLLAWAVVDRISLKRRGLQPAAGPQLPPARFNDAVAVGGGLVLYLAFAFGLHAWLIGVPIIR